MSQALPTTEPEALKVPTLAELRKKAGLNTRTVAALINRTQPRITQIEARGTKDIDMLKTLAGVYGVTRDEIEAANNLARHR